MLEFLRIRNLALIEDMTLEFSSGMNVLTGETGAGKTFIIKALNFLLGDKLDASLVRDGAERAQIEAVFLLNEEELVLRRELLAQTGRSRLFINDVLHSQEQLKHLREQLVAYTSQHSQQQLLQHAFQEAFFENLLGESIDITDRDGIIASLHDLAAKRHDLEAKYVSLADKRDLLEMQQEEISKIKPVENEEEELEELRSRARRLKSQREQCNVALGILYGEEGPGLIDQLAALRKILLKIDSSDSIFQAIIDATGALEQELHSAANKFRQAESGPDSIDLEYIESRLYNLAQLKRKMHRSLPQILKLSDEIDENLSFLDSCALDLSNLEREEVRTAEQLAKVLDQIKPVRRKLAGAFTRKLELILGEMGFSQEVKVIPQFVEYKIWNDIYDERVHLLWAPNPGQKPQPLHKIASGGELSRFLLALASVKDHNSDLTFIFDEVDAGVGGLTLNKIATKLEDLAKLHQIILITHWPQLASRAVKHFQVIKTIDQGQTSTSCLQLDSRARNEELSRMAGGGVQGEAFVKSLESNGY